MTTNVRYMCLVIHNLIVPRMIVYMYLGNLALLISWLNFCHRRGYVAGYDKTLLLTVEYE